MLASSYIVVTRVSLYNSTSTFFFSSQWVTQTHLYMVDTHNSSLSFIFPFKQSPTPRHNPNRPTPSSATPSSSPSIVIVDHQHIVGDHHQLIRTKTSEPYMTPSRTAAGNDKHRYISLSVLFCTLRQGLQIPTIFQRR